MTNEELKWLRDEIFNEFNDGSEIELLDELRKERDELASGIVDIVYRTVASGGVLYVGHSGQVAIEIAKRITQEAK